MFRRIDQRVAGFLWEEFSCTGSKTLDITHDRIARNIGSAREVVTKALKYLAGHEAIGLRRGKVVILSLEKLQKFL